MRRGRFITFEGGEGAGKSSQCALLFERLNEVGVRTLATREPGGSPHAERLREILLSGNGADLGPLGEAVIFNAARIDHLDQLIKPALEEGLWVICDRFMDSTRAYQGAAGKVSETWIDLLERAAVGLYVPDLTFLLDLPPEMGLARAEKRRGALRRDRFESEDLSFHQALRTAFCDIAQRHSDRVVKLNASDTFEEIADSIWNTVSKRFSDAF